MCCLYQDTQCPCVVVWIQGETLKEKTLRWKNKTHTRTHTHKRKRKQRETDCREKSRPGGHMRNSWHMRDYRSLEGITIILLKDNKTHHLRNKEIFRTIKPQKPAKVTLDNAQISSIRDVGMNMRAYPAKYVTLQQYFSHPSLLFSKHTHRTNRWETTNSNPTWTNQTI